MALASLSPSTHIPSTHRLSSAISNKERMIAHQPCAITLSLAGTPLPLRKSLTTQTARCSLFKRNAYLGASIKQRRRVGAVVSDEQTMTAVVSQNDDLTLIFKAEGKLDDSRNTKVIQALEALEDVSDVKLEMMEGMTTIELAKKTTIQATGVSSGLVEYLQKLGFKLQILSLCFEDEEDKEDELNSNLK